MSLLWPSLRPRVCESSSLSNWFFPFRGPTPLAFVPQFEALSESLTHSIPHSFLVGSLSAYAVGLADALWLCLGRAFRFFFASISLVDHVHIIAPLAPCLRWWYQSFASGSSCGGASPHVLGSVGAHGVSGGSTYVAFHQTWSAVCQKLSIYCFLLLYTGNWYHRHWII